ncbi:MAG: anhydro-N-acetylmuramic acid kinase, partial [Flammeovirgaceae bacterium]|nr:anhydro-N-acetylmuramic acid kinase [Flammeovirgaceae bacterium]
AYGKYVGEACDWFIKKNRLRSVDFIASHGHTIFHQPQHGFTFQIGNGNFIHAITGFPVIFDFRSLDVARGGQGAPLVPVADKFLFSEYDACLNLGGIANISMEEKRQRIAFDICFANMALNYLASKIDMPYDSNGERASSGQVNSKLLQSVLNVYTNIRNKRPSLGREFFESAVVPLINTSVISVEDKLATFVESIAVEVAASIPLRKKKLNILCTGGGAFNSFLIYRIAEHCDERAFCILADETTIKYKEAMAFSFLGILRSRNEMNCLKSVTGALQDSSSGLMVGF